MVTEAERNVVYGKQHFVTYGQGEIPVGAAQVLSRMLDRRFRYYAVDDNMTPISVEVNSVDAEDGVISVEFFSNEARVSLNLARQDAPRFTKDRGYTADVLQLASAGVIAAEEEKRYKGKLSLTSQDYFNIEYKDFSNRVITPLRKLYPGEIDYHGNDETPKVGHPVIFGFNLNRDV